MVKQLIMAGLILAGAGVAEAQATGPVVGPTNTLQWVENDITVTSYRFLYCRSTAGCTAGATGVTTVDVATTANSTPISSLNIVGNGQVFVCVKAVNPVGPSACSNEAPFVFAGTVPAAPTGLGAH